MESDELKTEYNRLYDEFKKIEYGETDHRYRKSLKSIVEQKINENDQIAAEIFESSLKSLIALTNNSEEEKSIAYKAFFCLNTFYRYKKLLKKLDYLINGYKDIFSHFKTYNLLYFLKNLITKSDLLESIEKSYDVIKSEDYSKDIGYLHLFADIVITYYEGTGKSIEDKIWLVEVEKALEKAIELKRDYAKFYSTKARLLAIKKQYDSALSEINKALQFEEDSKVFKITNYQDIKILIISDRLEEKLHEMNLETKKVTEQFEEKLRKINLKTENELDTVKNEMKESIDKVTLRSYEVIVFFIGIISLIMAAINVTSQMKPLEAIIVLMAFLGLLLCAFFCLGIIIHRRELPNNEHSGKKMPFSFNIPLILGILLIVVAVLFCISIPMNLDDNQVNNVNLENKKMPREIPAKDLTTSAEEEQQQ